MLTCKFCSDLRKNENSLRNHERMCSKNPAKQDSPFAKYHELGIKPWNKGRTDLGPAWNRGLPGTFAGRKHSEVTKKKMSDDIKKRYAAGWECKAGRCKKYEYTSPIAGNIKLDGTWELSVAKYLDTLGVSWERNKKRFEYIREDGRCSTYQPDFFVADWDLFIEVKGYETDLDRLKWEQFPHKLEVWRRSKIEQIIGDVPEPGLSGFPAKEED